MPLYTMRCTGRPLGGAARGSATAQMVHHFTFPDDQAAVDALPNFRDRYNSSAIARRWLWERDTPVHEATVYRRSTENRRSWTRLASLMFELADWDEFTIPVEIGGFGIGSVPARVAPVWPDQRGSVLVIERTANPNIRRRTYVGPITPIAVQYLVEFSIEVPWNPLTIYAGESTFWTPYFVLGDYPYQWPGEDVHRWREDMAELARDHVRDMDAEMAQYGGVKVVPSWVHNEQLPVTETTASLIRADVRSRGGASAMLAPI